jgi:mono/diheme cytochrome c family protein
MKRVIHSVIFIVIATAFLVACQGSTENKKAQAISTEQLATEINKNLPAQSSEKVHPGKAVFTQYCMACHQADGTGVPGMHPPLTPGSWVDKDPKELIAIMMKGLSGKIEVNGESYKNFMPSHAQLTDDEIANVLSYIRISFGNALEPVTPDMVKAVRSGK